MLGNDEHAKEVKLFGLAPLLLGRYRAWPRRSSPRIGGSRCGATAWGYALSLLGTAAFYGCYALMVAARCAGGSRSAT